jgi:hypothetical protein
MIIVEVRSELIDYETDENGLKEIGRMTFRPEDHKNRLTEGKKAADEFENALLGLYRRD